jgi:quinol monooxygenase YgiN
LLAVSSKKETNPNALTLLFAWDSVANAQKYAQNPALKAAMQDAGVKGPPTFAFLQGNAAVAVHPGASYMLIQHPVADFAQWKAVFDSKSDLRKSSGEKSALIFHDAANPNQLTLLMEWDSIANAQKYTQNPDLKAAMQNAGVNGPPTFTFITAD